MLDNAAAYRFLTTFKPPKQAGLTMALLVKKHGKRQPAFKPYRVFYKGDGI